MNAIITEKLSKSFNVMQKSPGLWNALVAAFRRQFRTVKAVEEVSFRIGEGELVGFLGPNGAGKTTTLKLLSGLLYPTSGVVKVLGEEPWKRRSRFQKQIALVMGNRSQLWWELPAQESLLLNKEIYELDDAGYERTLSKLKELLEIEHLLSIPVKKLSLGERMKAELCAALLHRPKLLLLDEPTLGLDIVMQKKIRGFLREYNAKYKATILMTSHNMDDVVELCQRIIIIHHGHLIYDGSLKNIVEKYSSTKRVQVDFREPVSAEILAKWGAVSANGGYNIRAFFEVSREEVSKRTSQILSALPVADLTISETPVEDVIREIFKSSQPVSDISPGRQRPFDKRETQE